MSVSPKCFFQDWHRFLDCLSDEDWDDDDGPGDDDNICIYNYNEGCILYTMYTI